MKKIVINLFFLAATLLVYGQQDTIYLNEKYEKITIREKAKYYKVIEKLSDKRITEKLFHSTGEPKFQTAFLFNKKGDKIRDGKHNVFYPNGMVQIEIDFVNGKRNGKLLSYWENGNIKREDIYKKNKFVSGQCWDIDGKKIDFYKYEIDAVFPGGKYNLEKYLIDNIKIDYSTSRIKNWNVKVKFYIDEHGVVSKPNFINRSLDVQIDVQIINTILKMPNWKPALRDGTPIGIWKLLPIKLRN